MSHWPIIFSINSYTDINIRQDQRVNVQSADHYQYYSQSDDTDDITTVD